MQLELDLSPPRAAEIVVFPFDRRRALVARTANGIASRTGKRRQAYWDRVVTDIIEELTRAGVDHASAGVHLRAFREAVRLELVRRTAA